MNEIIYFKRNLPHYHSDIGTFFITSRISDSLPKYATDKLKMEYNNEINRIQKLVNVENRKIQLYECDKKYFARFDRILNTSSTGCFWLKDASIANIVINELNDLDNNVYNLICYCIMPNHFHLLIEMDDTKYISGNPLLVKYEKELRNSKSRLSFIMKIIKGKSAFKANKILNRSGKFWHHENYDHLIRNSREYERIINYILMNPVKAGFVKEWTDWEWSYCKYLNDLRKD